MNRRIRFLAALLALIGFSAYFAQSPVAAACTTDMVSMNATAGDPHAGMNHAAAPAAETVPANDDSTPGTTSCPMGMIAGNNCSVAATLPAGVSTAHSSAPGHEDGVKTARTVASLLLVHAFFHPPRA
jgi:hypothetical protein